MSRNLCTSGCCGVLAKIGDLVGKPVEFRRYARYAPEMGTKWTCPKCGRDYFAIWRKKEEFWGKSSINQAHLPMIDYGYGQPRTNTEQGRFYIEYEWEGKTHREETGYFVIDLSYYESFNDEPGAALREGERPSYWCEQADDTQLSWGVNAADGRREDFPHGEPEQAPKGRIGKIKEAFDG